MAPAANSSPIFRVSPSRHHCHSTIRVKSSSVFFSLKPNLRLVCFCSTTYVTAPLTESANASVTDQNAKIRRLCEMGDLWSAVEVLRSSETSDLDLKSYCSILQLCAEINSLRDGENVHSIIDSNMVAIEGLLGAKLVFMYVSCGDLKKARQVFDQINNEKAFLWNLMIREYSKVGDFRESMALFRRMLNLGIEPNSHTFSSIFKCFAALGYLKEGRVIHGSIYKLGFGSCNIVVNSLIAFYFKCGKVQSAQKLFDKLSERDLISWNSMLNGYVMNSLAEKGIRIFTKMLYSGIGVDLATLVNVLVACANVGTLLFGKAIHGYALKSCLDGEIMFSNTLLDMYSKCGDLEGALRVFERMDDRSVVSWTSMIAAYTREGHSDGAIRLFNEMESKGVDPDIFAITSVLHACASNGYLDHGRSIHNYLKENNMDTSLFVCNVLMNMYAKCGCMKDALLVFSQVNNKDIISWNTMIGGYSRNCLPNAALNLFFEMQREFRPYGTTISCVLPACASLASLDRGREIHGFAVRNGYFSERQVANALVDMYAKCGALILARVLFDMIPNKDLVSWTVMVAGYGMHGFGREAVDAFNEMRLAGVRPDEVSFISILYACSHSGLLDEGWKFFDLMRSEYYLEPQLDHYACMVDLLARTGNLSRALKFIETMPIEPDATIWGALLCGCRMHHDVKMAEKVAEQVFSLEPENTGYYVLLANIYAEAEIWEEVRKLREKIGRRGLKKNPGCSWIEIKGKVHIFVAGDCSNPHIQKIESLLKKLRMRMEEEGYSPKLKYALINADEMEKDVVLCGHSEKLAMAFGILSLPRGKVIRVAKNLRVCGDCHEMAKFMSKTTGREIVLRDANRFHHFKDGHCSCRGFW